MEWSIRIVRVLLHAYPPAFRARYGEDLVAFVTEDRAHPRYGTGWRRPWRFWVTTVCDLVVGGWAARRDDRRLSRSAREQPSGRTARGPGGWAGRLVTDVRDAARSLVGTPGPTAMALGILTLGLAASTSIFAVVDIVALRGLPFEDARALTAVAETALPSGQPWPVAAPNYAAWVARQHSFVALGASSIVHDVLVDHARPSPCWACG
jgi:hypothetical protein